MTIDRNKLEPNGWTNYGSSYKFGKTFYRKNTDRGVLCLVALHDDMNDVTIDTTEFNAEVEPDFLKWILEEVEKLEPDEGGKTR